MCICSGICIHNPEIWAQHRSTVGRKGKLTYDLPPYQLRNTQINDVRGNCNFET